MGKHQQEPSGGLPFIAGIDAARRRVLAITPFERPDLSLARACARHGAAVAVDLGRDAEAWPALLTALARERLPGLGLRIADGVTLPPQLLPPETVRFLIVGDVTVDLPIAWRHLPVLAQVGCSAEAGFALTQGVAGLIAKGQESGGRIGDESAFVLLQRVLERAAARGVPVWAQGGIALNTAAAAVAGGAEGVIVDAALAGMPECSLPAEIKAQILAMDGSEVRELAGYQVYTRGVRDAAALETLDADGVRAALAAGRLLPIGQDAALARTVLADCANVEALLNTLRLRIPAQLRQARKLRVLDEHNPWARAAGTRYPIAQGPMTRVSDTAEFAAAVAGNGGLPFVALSLMKADASRALLEATQLQAKGRPWGVGVLGFAAPEILDPQLELVKALKPAALLLAGGRPAQARPFVELGIPTYLHVPSPGLLELFLKDGATHFVFEGRECGGHVGPRYSFVLWEQAIAQLMQVDDPQRLHVLFAGGIHDERSAAMVATLAAPLAARGARIGVLMGTAYIATEEAVRCGAVLDDFQRQALAGDSTVLVETAPGHAIRCLPSGFVGLFEREKARLRADGVDTKQAWAALETLTVGRLRIATKGVDYVDGRLAAIAQKTQRAEGMYMIGQAIALKRSVTTVAALHAQVSTGASAYLDGLKLPEPAAAQAEPVAVVGMACIYPGAPDLESFWANILEGRDSVSEVPADRWNVAQYYQAPTGVNGAPAGKSVSKWGGFIDETPFDPLQYGIPPASLAAIEPVQLLSLEVTQQALRDAGYDSRWFDREKTSVIFGAEAGMDLGSQYTFRNLYPQYCGELPKALADALPSLTEDSFPGMLVNVISGRIANRLGLGGVNYSVTSACASSLTAIELGVKELRAGSSDMVLAGGADFHNGISDFLMFTSVGALSAKGRCRSFDNEADGIALGEGVGVVVLKRLADAERDGDRIYAVIDGIAGSSDGKGLGLTAPRKEGQRRAIERTYWQAGAMPAEIGLVEAHGTGTVVGDRTELKTLTEVYTALGATPGQAGLGSVKSQIGHTKCAAGIAGFIKVAKALHHRVLPPTGQITTPNASWRAATSPFQLNRKPLPWLPAEDSTGGVTRGAVSAFGFGGTNFHTVLSAYPAHRSALGARQWPAELFAVRGATLQDALGLLRRLAAYIEASDAPVPLRELAASLWHDGSGPVQLTFVAADRQALRARIADALAQRGGSGVHLRAAATEARTAFLFAGQGSQYPGMLRELFVYFPALQSLLAAGAEYLPAIWPATAYDEATRAAQQRRLTDTRNTQPALGLVEFAAFEWLRGLGLLPDMAAGHSYGELAALAAAGAFDAATLLRLSRARAEAIVGASGEGDAGAMAAVRLDVEALQPLLAGFPTVVMANQNSPIQTVISGPTADVEAACALLAQNKISCKRIDTDRAFHSPLMADAQRRYAAALAGEDVGALQWPVYSNITAEPHPRDDGAALRASLARHIVSPVRFVAEIERMYADGARVFVEIGPRKVLSGLVGRILKDRPHTMIAIDGEERGLAGLLDAVAQLAVHQAGFDAAALFAGRAATLDLAQPRRLAPTTWMINGGRARPLRGKPPAHAAAVITAPVLDAALTSLPAVVVERASAGEQALVSYLGNMRELVNAQRDVLLGYFGAPVARSAAPAPVVELAPRAAPPPLIAGSTVTLPATTVVATMPASRETLLEIIGERTGYPVEMLDPDLDLEADLSIDSIKRIEVIGELAERLSLRARLGGEADAALEQLATQKTLRAMQAWLDARLPAMPAVVAVHSEIAAAVAAPTVTRRPAEILLAIVSNSTGYPPEALDLDLDLEADLSIDSIKRIEVIGELAEQLSLRALLGGEADSALEQLAAQKTLRAMLGWLEARQPAPPPAIAAGGGAVAVVPAAAATTAAVLLEVVGASTGYPPEALDLDLDLEADLSIDSIKRIEIIGQLAERLGLAGREDLLEQVAALKTLRAMLAALDHAAPTVMTVAAVGAGHDFDAAIPLERYVLRRQPVAAAWPEGRFDGKSFLISDDRMGLAPLVAARLERLGARARIVDFTAAKAPPAEAGQVDGLIHLWSFNPRSRAVDVKRFFAVVRESLGGRARHLLVASSLGGDFGDGGAELNITRGGGLAGFIKSVAKELPDLRAHWVDFDPAQPLDEIAAHIESELLAGNPLAEVAYRGGCRYAREAVATTLDTGSLDRLPLDADSVVLLTGGARGITALVAVELARRYRCQLEIVGRSPLPQQDEDAVTRGIDDPRRLRQALLAAHPQLKPAEIEKLARRIVADREVRATLAEVAAAGSSLHYTPLDVRASKSFAQFIDELYARRGRIDGVIHGAGVVEDKLVRDKTLDSFVRVFDTKVRGAMVLNRHIRDDVKFVVFFSSVASAFGNRGQVDYASANDLLDKLAHSWQKRIAGRVLSVNWGPWADTGMVSDSLKNEYHRKGIGLIPQDQGVQALLRELAGKHDDAQVVFMCGKPENFGAETLTLA